MSAAASHVFPRHCKQQPPRAVGGEGCYLIGEDGKRYLDGSGGAAVSCLGHGDREVIAAITAQVETLAFAHTGFFTSEPAETLADLGKGRSLLLVRAHVGLDHQHRPLMAAGVVGLLGGFGSLVGVDVEAHHLGSFGCEAHRGGAPDACGRPGYHHDLVCEAHGRGHRASRSLTSWSLRARLSILPEAFRGSDSVTMVTTVGTLNPAMCSRR